MNANGDIAPPIFIIQDDNMEKGPVDVHKVTGIGLGAGVGEYGWIVAQSRCPGEAFYRWMFDNVVIPMVAQIKATYDLPVDALTWYLLDGEGPQIAAFKDNAYCTKFRDLNIAVCKPAGSTTEITQACDQDFFAPKKDGLKWSTTKTSSTIRRS